ncbi:uncharacterized protein BT62DRAFT_929785 [Guyanagaster necrorhizus]|uniref:WW domain-containing protein n=1 Tax=Guyanagaster necrorhizus TaxID=856835 RepID=A0A9P7VZK4_9AGAR|nr:uncharacterized protein BT62DRAFT_929785 [Guyanagaster necrorhizus MCA 3950]KAG7448691.1 hypothetical protein BT62DRAFT_929785 [Guyanagaster necrorhizus MCA 3950]
MAMVDDKEPEVCSSKVPCPGSPVGISVENPSFQSLNTGALCPTPMTSRSQVHLEDYSHVNLSTRRLPRHGSRPPSIAQIPIDQGSIRAYSCSNASRSSQDVRHSMSNLATYTHPVNSSCHRLSSSRPGPLVVTPPSPKFDTAFLVMQLTPAVKHDGSDCAIPGGITTLTAAYPAFWPLAPQQVQRYERELVAPNRTEYWIDPLTISFHPDHCHDGWSTYVHPEGARYFVHERKVLPCTGNYHDSMISSGCLLPRIFTDINVCESEKLELVTKFMVDMEDYIRAKGVNIHPNVDLVFDLIRDPDSGNICCAYYFASHDNRSTFWLDDFDATYLNRCNEVRGVTELSHIGHEIEAQYWYHCQLFPTCLEMTEDIIDELRDILIYCLGDTMTSPTPNSPYGVIDLQPMLNLTNSIKESVKKDQRGLPGSVCSIGRFMYIFVQQRFYNFHGQPGARLEREKSVYGRKPKRTALITLLSPLLFFAPDIHLASLEKIWGDGLVSKVSWGIFIEKLNAEWQEFILYSTVLLNANVAFLAIQSVDDSSDNPGRSPAQLSSYLSTIASIGSIILGLLLIRKHRSKARDSSEEAWLFLRSQKHNKTGLETLAILYGLPYALLMWAMVSFLAAFSLMCFTASNSTVRMLVGSAWLAIGVLILWCIMTSWETKQPDHRWYGILLVFLDQVWHRLHEPMDWNIAEKLSNLNWPLRRPSMDSRETAVV